MTFDPLYTIINNQAASIGSNYFDLHLLLTKK